MNKIQGKIVLITGADGGLGVALVSELIFRNAKKIYATGLSMTNLKIAFEKYGDKVVCIELDVTSTESIKNCADLCKDINILINNAGIELKVPFIADKASQAALFEMKVNYIGVIEMINQFLPHLIKSQNSTVVNVLSLGSLVIVKRLGTYCASKTATHILTETIREELAAKGIKVIAVYMGYVNTLMVPEETKTLKSEAIDIAREMIDGIELGDARIYPDPITREFVKNNPINTVFFE